MRLQFYYMRMPVTAVFLCLLLAFTSCSCDADAIGDSADLMVSFTLRLEHGQDGRAFSSRAGFASSYPYAGYGPAWGGDYPQKEGNEFDSRLLKEHFHMLLLEKNTNKVVGKMEHDKMNVLVYNPNEDYTIVEFLGALDTDLSTGELDSDDKYKVMIFANGNACSVGLEDTFSGTDKSFSHIGQPGDKNSDGEPFDAIPMWGVAPAKLKGIKPGQRKDLGTVEMLRSMAKIIVDVATGDDGNPADAVKNVKLTALTVTNCNSNGEMLPNGWEKLDETKKLKIEETLNIPASAYRQNLSVEATNNRTDIEFYVPEYKNTSDAEFLLKVKYTVGEEEKEGEIHICKYNGGKPDTSELWPIVRNHIYQYTITGVEPTGDVAVDVQVSLNWDDTKTLTPTYGGGSDYEYGKTSDSEKQ